MSQRAAVFILITQGLEQVFHSPCHLGYLQTLQMNAGSQHEQSIDISLVLQLRGANVINPNASRSDS